MKHSNSSWLRRVMRILTTLAMLSSAIGLQGQPIVDTTTVEPTHADPYQDRAYSTGLGLRIDEPELKDRPQRITAFGYYRFFFYGRSFSDPYPNLTPYDRAYGVGDGYREPTMSLNIVARPHGKYSFGTELFFLSPYLGTGPQDNDFTLNLGLNFYGNFRTDIGNFNIRAGGIHWYNLSPFTIGVYQVLDRYSIFDRTPWEGVNNTEKYESYYSSGTPNPGDQRWNYQAFQGLIINGGKLPGNIAFDLFWGKTQPNSTLANAVTDPLVTIQNPTEAGNVPTYQGFAGDGRIQPSLLTGGRIAKLWGQNHIAFNTIYSMTALDSLDRASMNYRVHSLSYGLQLRGASLSGELAMGAFESPITERRWGEALMVRLQTDAESTFIPIDIQLYQISKDFYNQNGEINTASNPDIQKNFPVEIAAGQASAGQLITQINQLAHNRRGININLRKKIGALDLGLGWGLSHEIDTLSTILSYNHRINGLALSRVYNPFPANATRATVFGPYGRKISFFRGVFERVQTTDLDPATAGSRSRKYFSNIELNAKYKLNIGARPLYIFYLGSFASASYDESFYPHLDDAAYLLLRSHEIDLYYELLPRFILAGYYGRERAQAGLFTEWGETNQPRDQTGTAWGLGFDYSFNNKTGLYFRYRKMDFNDASFELDHYSGTEYTLELKTFF